MSPLFSSVIAGLGRSRGKRPAARLVQTQAGTVRRTRDEIGIVHTVGTEQPVRQLEQRRRAVDFQLGQQPAALIPARQHQPGIIAKMVEVEMRKEHVRNPRRRDTRFQQAVMRAEAVVEQDDVISDFDEMPRAHPLQRRFRCSGSQQAYTHFQLFLV